MEVVVDTPSIAVLDGKFGFGQTMTPQAVRSGSRNAEAGLAAIALRNSGHIGRVGEWAEMAAAEGLVSVHFVNAAGSVLVAPFGGVERRLSTAPDCIGMPRTGQDPMMLDFATSLVAEGKVLVASQGGKKLPADALVVRTASSAPTRASSMASAPGPRDHTKGKGALRAFGEHKGSGLALMCELFGGALTGNGASSADRRFAKGMFAIYIDPQGIDPSNFFDGETGGPGRCVRPDKCNLQGCTGEGCSCDSGTDGACDNGLICCADDASAPGGPGRCEAEDVCLAHQCQATTNPCPSSCAAGEFCHGCCSGYCGSDDHCGAAPCTGVGCECTAGVEGSCSDGLVCCQSQMNAPNAPGGPGMCATPDGCGDGGATAGEVQATPVA